MNVPICINPLCNKPCAKNGIRYRPICASCHAHGGARPGVVRFKRLICENIDGRLGFPCVIDWSKVHPKRNLTELDHKDGNHLNNTIENIQELCMVCHDEKSKQNGDLKGHRYQFHSL
jgi:cytochrome c553